MPSSNGAKRSLVAFSQTHDRNYIIPERIRQGLAELAKAGAEYYEYEQEFLRRTKISTTDIAKYRDRFSSHIVIAPELFQKGSRVPRRIYCGTSKLAAKMRKIIEKAAIE